MLIDVQCCGGTMKFIVFDACHGDAPVPGATVTVKNVATGNTVSGTTNSSGVVWLSVAAGESTIQATAAGCMSSPGTYYLSGPGPHYVGVWCASPTITVTGTGCNPFCPASNTPGNVPVTVTQGGTTIASGTTPFSFPMPGNPTGPMTLSWPAQGCCAAGQITVNTTGWNYCQNQTIGITQALKPMYLTDANGVWPLWQYSGGIGGTYWTTGLITVQAPILLNPPYVTDSTELCLNDCSAVPYCDGCPAYELGDYYCAPIYSLASKTSPSTGMGAISYYYTIGFETDNQGNCLVYVQVNYVYSTVSTWDWNIINEWACFGGGPPGCDTCVATGPTLVWTYTPPGPPVSYACSISNAPANNWLCTCGYSGPDYFQQEVFGTKLCCPGNFPFAVSIQPPAGQGFAMSWSGDSSCSQNIAPPPGGTTVSIGC